MKNRAENAGPWYRRLSLRTELKAGFGAVILLMLVVGGVSLVAQSRSSEALDSLVSVVHRIADLSLGSNAAMLKARRAEKDFLLFQREFGFQEARSRYLTLFRTSLAEVRQSMAELRTLSAIPETVALTRSVDAAVGRYEAGFIGVVDLYGRRGFASTGLEGEIRRKAGEIEALVRTQGNDRLLVGLLTLRRHEKDFIARGIEKYVEAFAAGIEDFEAGLAVAQLPAATRALLGAAAAEYARLFGQYVQNDARIDAEQAIYLAAAHTVEPLLEELRAGAQRDEYATGINAARDAQIASWTIRAAVLLASLLGLGVAIAFGRRIMKSVDQCLQFAARVAQGDLSSRMASAGEMEFRTLATALNRMTEALERRESEQKRTETHIRRLNRIYAVSNGISALIVRARGRDELFREACRIAVEEGHFAKVWLGTVDRGSKEFRIVAAHGGDPLFFPQLEILLKEKLPRGRGAVAQAIATLQPAISNDMVSDPEVVLKDNALDGGARSLAVLPLIVAGEAVGVFTLNAEVLGFFDEEEMKLLTELAGNIAFAIDHIEKRERLDYLASYDELTGLANRGLFLERLDRLLTAAGHESRRLAVLVIDIERFRSINESVGRQAGDDLLRQFTARLQGNMIDPEWLARIGGDQFATIVPDASGPEALQRIEQRMGEVLREPFALGELDVHVSLKTGIALFPRDGVDAATLLSNAEAALKKAKAGGERYLFYAREMTTRVAANLVLENRLRLALEKEEFVLHYQPKINLLSGKLSGAEALIRWNEPRTGLVPPGHFIPILEETGMILDVGRWGLRRAIEEYLRWRAAGLPAVRIAVNVSPLQLRHRGFAAEIEKAIGIHPDAAGGLELEITESVIMRDINHNITTLQAIRAMGVTVAIDDFGTGFSSLAYLSKLPVDTLKIDRSFVVDMTTGPQGMALVSTVIKLAHSLQLKAVAEGVETEEQSNLLRLLGCDEMQGFLFSKAVPAANFEARFLARAIAPAQVA